MPIIHIVICILFAICFAGLAYMLMKTAISSAGDYSSTYSENMAREFENVYLFIPPQKIAFAGWIAGALVFTAVFLITADFTSMPGFAAGLFFGLLFGLGALFTPRGLLEIMKKRRLKKFELQLVDTLVSMSNGLKAGFSINQVFESVVKDGDMPISQEFDVFLQEIRLGVNTDEALANMEKRVGSQDLSLVVTAIQTARKTGGNLTEIFEKISATIRERMRIENRIRTLTSQGKLQGIIVGSMPVLIGTAMTLLDPGMMMPFFRSSVGVIVIAGVLVLIGLGALVIRKIINIDI